jgi:hypothetical protein
MGSTCVSWSSDILWCIDALFNILGSHTI